MAKSLKNVILNKLSKKSFLDHFYDDLIELINDEDLLVRLDAIDTVIDIM
jgi:hypothetical protein